MKVSEIMPNASASARSFLSSVSPITLIIILGFLVLLVVILIVIFGFFHPSVGGLSL